MQAIIQFQGSVGDWRDAGRIPNNPSIFTREMQNVQRRYPRSRIRVVDSASRVLDIL